MQEIVGAGSRFGDAGGGLELRVLQPGGAVGDRSSVSVGRKRGRLGCRVKFEDHWCSSSPDTGAWCWLAGGLARLRLRVVSSRTDNELAAVRAHGMLDQFEWTGVLPNAEALREVARAHATLVLQQGAPPGHRLRTVRAKTYEYMAVGKPLLACVPGGDGADFVARYGRGLTRDPSSVDAIVGGLCELYDRYDEIARAPIDRAFVAQFEWGELARQLDGVMNGLRASPAS